MHSYAHWRETNPDGTVADYYRAIGLSPAGERVNYVETGPPHGFYAEDYVERDELERLHAQRTANVPGGASLPNVSTASVVDRPNISLGRNELGPSFAYNAPSPDMSKRLREIMRQYLPSIINFRRS